MQYAPLTWPRKVDLFGVGVSVTTCDEAARLVLRAARAGVPACVSCHAVHALVESSRGPAERARANGFDMVTPDGQPLRWAMNLLHKTRLPDRIRGTDLTMEICRRAAEEDVAIYLYGGSPPMLEDLRTNLSVRFPGLRILAESPPFRPLTEEEDDEAVRRINQSEAGVLFVGLGFPKQDIFAHAHRDRIRPVQVCVGAAFDFLAGHKQTAPLWMQRCGLEWLHRLCAEPRRLWRRYLVTNTLFLTKLAAALFRAPSQRLPPVPDDVGQTLVGSRVED